MLSGETCTFCGLLCDDISLDNRSQQAGASSLRLVSIRTDSSASHSPLASCPLAERGFAQADRGPIAVAPRYRGQQVSWETAIAKAAELIGASSHCLFSGMATDVQGARRTMQLADRIGAIVDHPHSVAFHRNLRSLQQTGWMVTTLSEVRNRADAILTVGSGLFERFPRLLQRVFFPQERIAAVANYSSMRHVHCLGSNCNIALPRSLGNDERLQIHPCADAKLLSTIGAIRHAWLTPKSPIRKSLDSSLMPIVESFSRSKYSVIAWAAADFAFAGGDLLVDAIIDLIAAGNETGRMAGMPLGGNQGDLTALQVCTWQTGFPLPQSLAGGRSHYDPNRYSTERLLGAHPQRAQGYSEQPQIDLLVWIASITSDMPLPAGVFKPSPTEASQREWAVPSVMIGHPNMSLPTEPELFLPTAIPGIDDRSQFFRGDSVVVVPAGPIREKQLPSVAEVIEKIIAALGQT